MSRGSLSRDRWSVLEPLLDDALELAPHRRSAFLDEACHGDVTLRAELASLLAACDRGTSMLTEPAAMTYAPLLVDPPRPLPTELGGRYRIVREIGRGGMATVYLADDPKHARQVAVKTLHADIARIIGRERFAREIEIVAGLSHPHILPLHDSGEESSPGSEDPPFFYFVSPFVEGESLRDLLRHEPRVAPSDAVRLGREIALALDYAHRRGVIHLDIKPENVLLQEGHAVITDFGIAQAMSSAGDDTLQQTAPVIGTPSYMSPEQASGAADIDGRSDVYSLGCVLYELITGQRPFDRLNAAETIDELRLGGAPDVTTLYQYAPRALATVILRAMASARDDRFATAGELASALSASIRPTSRLRISTRNALVAAAAIVAATLVGLWASRRAPVLDANLVAVAPFDVQVPSLELWKEGLVDVLSRNLDGAGALHTVPSSVVIRRWRGRVDAQSARALGEATGARLVLFGGLLSAGDSVHATVSLLDAQTGRTLAEIEQRDETGRLDRLSDSLTVAVLRELGRSRKMGMVSATSWPTVSISALKAYLQGEQFYRAAQWDSAQFHFEHALAKDSTFALAYHRLAAVRRWRDATFVPDSATFELMRKPSRFPLGLAARERLLATVDSLSAEAYFAWRRGNRDGKYEDEEVLVHSLYRTLTDGLKSYPNDAELAFLLAEAHSRFDEDVVIGEIDDRATLALYDRAIALDSTFAPAYVTPISLAAYLNGPDSARRYVTAYLRLVPPESHSQIIRLADVLLDSTRSTAMDINRLVDSLPADGLCQATRLLRHVPDASETIVRVARAMIAQSPDSMAGGHIGTCAAAQTVDGLQFRGHLRDAHRLASLKIPWLRPAIVYNMARTGVISPYVARLEFQHILALAPQTRMTKAYGWWAIDGDTAAIQAYINGFTESESHLGTLSGESMLRASVAAGQAHLALAKRDTAAALRVLLTTSDTLHECWNDDRLVLVQLLEATGQYREAGERLERRWPGTTSCSNGFDDVLWTLERARVFERLGRRGDALANYMFVVDAWRGADKELQPFLRESREAVARLQ